MIAIVPFSVEEGQFGLHFVLCSARYGRVRLAVSAHCRPISITALILSFCCGWLGYSQVKVPLLGTAQVPYLPAG